MKRIRLVLAALAVFTTLALFVASEPLEATQPAGVPTPTQGRGRVVDQVREVFPPTRHWFQIVATAEFTNDGLERIVPDYSTLSHPRVRWQDASGHTLAAQFARDFRGATRIASGEDQAAYIDVFPEGGLPSELQIQDGLVVYAEAYRDTDVLYKSTPTHTDEYLLLRTADAPTRWSFRVELGPHIARLRQAGAAVEGVDARGVPWMRANPPFAVDASGQRVDGQIRLEGERIVAEIDTSGLTPPILVDPDWRSTGDMSYGRFYYGLDELPDGRLLATGGCSASVCSGDLSLPACRAVVGAAEALDLDTRTWSRLGEANFSAFFHIHESLRDGSVLIAGGCANPDCSAVSLQADVWDVASASFRAVANLPSGRAGMVSGPLPDGRVLVAGGCDDVSCVADSVAFDPATDRWQSLAPMNVARGRAAVSVLPDGRVLLVGGCTSISCAETLASAEVYDPALDSWQSVADMSTRRAGHWVAPLRDGRVMVGGGCATQDCASVLSSTEIFDPTSSAFIAAADLRQPRLGAVAVTLPDGSVLVSQGCASRSDCDLTNELWSPDSGEFGLIEDAVTTRAFHQLVLHAGSQQVVAAGGCQPRTCSWWNETYDVSTHMVAPDAGVVDAGMDASLDAGLDAGVGDAATADTSTLDAGAPPGADPGCGCAVPGGVRGETPARRLILLAIFGLLLRLRRRDWEV